MGKYMRHKRRVEKKAAIDGTLGVRTRARSMAMAESLKQATSRSSLVTGGSLRNPKDGGCAMECDHKELLKIASSSRTRNAGNKEDTYMELRSRSLQKSVRESGKNGATSDFLVVSESCCARNAKQASISLGISLNRKRTPALSARSSASASSRKGFAAIDAAEISFKASSANDEAKASTEASSTNQESISRRPHKLGMVTRNRKQQLASVAQELQCYEEKPVSACSLDRHTNCFPETSPDGFCHSQCLEEAPGSSSASRTRRHPLCAVGVFMACQAPSPAEMEAFFRCQEQQERRRFIDRYNFDPANEKPLRGRYKWKKSL